MSLLLSTSAPPASDDLSQYAGSRRIRPAVLRNAQAWVDSAETVVDDAPLFSPAKRIAQRRLSKSGRWDDPGYFDELVSVSVTVQPRVRRVLRSSLWINPDYFDELPPISPAIRGKASRIGKGLLWTDLFDDDGLPVVSVAGLARRKLYGFARDVYRGWVDTDEDIPGVIGGPGYPVDWQGRRRKLTLEEQPEKHLRHILDKVVAEYYGEIVDADLPKAVKAEAAAIVKPYVDSGKQARIPKPEAVDWIALQNDADAVAALIRLWGDELSLDDDDETILLLMGMP